MRKERKAKKKKLKIKSKKAASEKKRNEATAEENGMEGKVTRRGFTECVSSLGEHER